MSAKISEAEIGKSLLTHCGNSDLKRVTTLLASGMNADTLNFQNNGGSTALIVACGVSGEKVGYKVATVLLDAGILIDTANKNGMTALMTACSMNHSSIVDLLISRNADYTLRNKEGKTALELAKSRACRDPIVAMMEAHAEAEKQLAIQTRGAALVDMLYSRDTQGVLNLVSNNSFVEVYNVTASPRESCPYTRPIEIAVHFHLVDVVDTLLSAGADPDVVHLPDETTPVIRLCSEARAPSYPTTAFSRDKESIRFRLLELLVKVGKAGLNATRKDSWTALMAAAALGYLEDTELLISSKANPNIVEKHGDTALILAIKRSQIDVVRYLVESKAKVDIVGAEGMTALMWAAWKNNIPILQILIRSNAKANIRAKCGRTALCFAVQQGNVDAVSALVKSGNVDPNIPVLVTQSTPLLLAARANNMAIIDLLLEDSVIVVKLNQQNNNGETAVFWAALYGYVDVVIKLLIAGSNPYLKDQNGNDALSSKHDAIKEAIAEYTMDIFRPR